MRIGASDRQWYGNRRAGSPNRSYRASEREADRGRAGLGNLNYTSLVLSDLPI